MTILIVIIITTTIIIMYCYVKRFYCHFNNLRLKLTQNISDAQLETSPIRNEPN